MKVLVIPDIHLKPFMFRQADELMRSQHVDKAVCLMDIPDDWGKQDKQDEYAETFDAAEAFQKDHPDTLWCYGNHDLCYLWDGRESGYSTACADYIRDRLFALQDLIPSGNLSVVQKIDNVLFSHAGISAEFVRNALNINEYRTPVEDVLYQINQNSRRLLWKENSPIWFRVWTDLATQEDIDIGLYPAVRMYQEEDYLQVVGHTPVRQILTYRNMLFCDTFSTYRDGNPIGTEDFLLLDTETWEHSPIN